MKAYKVFNPDWTCRGFQYEVGITYEMEEKPELCSVGFHCCKKAVDCFRYYSFDPKNKVAEVEMVGDIVGVDGDKQSTNKIKIVREILWSELLDIVNNGYGNNGYGNNGDGNNGYGNNGDGNNGYGNNGYGNNGYGNNGDRNNGDRNNGNGNNGNGNNGYRNNGNGNNGNWNSCDKENGFFNSVTYDKIRVFNKWIDQKEWIEVQKPEFIYFDLNEWIYSGNMTDEEKQHHPEHETTGGYLKILEYKEAWKKAWDNATEADKKLLYALPGFDWDVFTEISGIEKPE